MLENKKSVLASVGGVLVSGVAYALAFPPTDWSLLAWVALVPLFLALRCSSTRMQYVAGALWGAWTAFTTAAALPTSTALYYGQPLWLGLAVFFAMAIYTTSTVMVLFVFVFRRTGNWRPALRPLLVGAAWVSVELLRARVNGNPWAAFGYSQVGNDALVQIADLAGVYGIGFVLVAVNAAIAETALVLGATTRTSTDPTSAETKSAAGGVLVALALVVALFAYGRFQLAAGQELLVSGTGVDAKNPTRVLVVQGNVDLGTQWRDEFYGETLDVHLELTLEGLRQEPAALVVWPENAMTFFLDREPLYAAAMARVLEPFGAQLIAGGPRVAQDESAYFNSAFLMSPHGAVLGHYDKTQLLPFAEYFPIPWLDFLTRNFGSVREFTPGVDSDPLSSSIGPAGVVICNESLFAELASKRVADGAELLVNLTNDGWLSDPELSGIAFAMTRLRAVEQRRYIVRASTSGPSAVVDPLGRVAAKTPEFSRSSTAGVVMPVSVRTVYSRLGDAFALFCLLASLMVVLMTRETAPWAES